MFIRFSTVAGSRGSADAVRDVHGFATRFYTDEGNFGMYYLYAHFSSDGYTTAKLTSPRHRRQQHSRVLHPGCHQVSGPDSRSQA